MKSDETREVAGRSVTLSHLDKMYFPEAELTKGDVVDYYERIAPTMLPYVVGRPLVVQRFPDGIGAEGFFQKNTPAYVPDWIERVSIDTAEGGHTNYPVVSDDAGLVYLANQGSLVFHTLLARADAPGAPVEVIFDLDPADDDLAPVRAAARELRAVLDDLALEPRVKTSGSRGLHVVVDVTDDDADFDLTRRFARRVADVVAGRDDFTLEHRKERREGRLFLDILRNAPASHAVAPWSLRPLPGAPVAAPLDWDEALAAEFHPQSITVENVFRRLGQKTDPWGDRPPPSQTIAEAMQALEK